MNGTVISHRITSDERERHMNRLPVPAPLSPDTQSAVRLLGEGHTCVIIANGHTYISDRDGISPLVGFLDSGESMAGGVAADRIVGRAAALLLLLAGVREVWGGVMSEGAAALLASGGIVFGYGALVPHIINRAGTGICPMEEAVAGIDDPALALSAIKNRQRELRSAVKSD